MHDGSTGCRSGPLSGAMAFALVAVVASGGAAAYGATFAVLARYPGERSEQYGWGVCRDVAADVLTAVARA